MRSTREKAYNDSIDEAEEKKTKRSETMSQVRENHGIAYDDTRIQEEENSKEEQEPPEKHLSLPPSSSPPSPSPSPLASASASGAEGEEEEEDDDDEEEEITRCVCGSQDYPGLPGIYRELLSKGELPGHPAIQLPPPSSHSLRRSTASKSTDLTTATTNTTTTTTTTSSSSSSSRSRNQNDSAADEDEAEDPPDPGSLFIQCDGCKVWQHGGCVGIMDEEASPEEYYCERCRGDLHRIVIDGKGPSHQQLARDDPAWMDIRSMRAVRGHANAACSAYTTPSLKSGSPPVTID
ncbi:hypothetical protein KEM54_006769 [Ascosphaera aggregata]|nr:hypothetical protein KEM54_006769 [Ascosphaera aggregata]